KRGGWKPPPIDSTRWYLHWADLPDNPGAGYLDERTIASPHELRVGVRLSEIPHRAVIDDVGATVGAELDVRGTVEPGCTADERLLEGGVVSKPLDLEAKRRVWQLVKVDQLDLVSNLGGGWGGICRREAEIALETVKR